MGEKGGGASITVVDNYSGFNFQKIAGSLDGGRAKRKFHGQWTSEMAGMIAPDATVYQHQWDWEGSAVTFRDGLNVINLSYGLTDNDCAAGQYCGGWAASSDQETSIINYAWGNGSSAVVVKAAGNDGQSLTAALTVGISASIDPLAYDLINAPNALFVGALDGNSVVNELGNPVGSASLAWYSNYAGSNTAIQNQFLVVGVNDSITGLAGTSFAAPIVSGYAAILTNKFGASPGLVRNRLLDTAREDTITGYNAAILGQGEASIGRALAPNSIYP